jgi:hypothetical protein
MKLFRLLSKLIPLFTYFNWRLKDFRAMIRLKTPLHQDELASLDYREKDIPVVC